MLAKNTKEILMEAAQDPPADATLEDAIERPCFLAKIERGLEQADSGMTQSHDEARERLGL